MLHHVTSCCINRFQPASNIGMPMRGSEKMTPAWAQRQEELLSDCIVSPDVFNHVVDRLRDFVVPYQESREMPGVMPLPGSPPPQGPCPDTRAGRCWGLWINSGKMTWIIHLLLEPGEAPVCVSNCNSS